MKEITLQVQGMSCSHCVHAIESALKEIKVNGKVDLATKTVKVSAEEPLVQLEEIKQVIAQQGFQVL